MAEQRMMPSFIQQLFAERLMLDLHDRVTAMKLAQSFGTPTPEPASYQSPVPLRFHGPAKPAADEQDVISLVTDTISGFDVDYDHDEMLAAIHDAGWKLVRNYGN